MQLLLLQQEDLYAILTSDNNVKICDPLSKLKQYLDNGVIRVGGWIRNAPVSYDVKHPVLLPRDSYNSYVCGTCSP